MLEFINDTMGAGEEVENDSYHEVSRRPEQSIHVQQHPKVGLFSGAVEVGNGEVGYPQWRHEVMCLIT